MRKAVRALAVSAGAAAGVAVARETRRRSRQARSGNRWLAVTINRPPKEVMADGRLPEPLERLRNRLDVQLRPAPGERGSELAVRLLDPPSATAASLPARAAGRDPRQEVRSALREAKSLLEAGEVMLPDAPPTTHDTPGGRLLGLVNRRAGGEGVL